MQQSYLTWLGLFNILASLLGMRMFIYFIQKTLHGRFEVHVPTQLVRPVVGLAVPLHLDTTPGNALHLLRYSLCTKLVGLALAAQVHRSMLVEISELLVVPSQGRHCTSTIARTS